jgi:enoyl-CoA hydratase
MEPKRGLFAGGGTTVRLPRQIPFPLAMEFLLCADLIDADRAYEMGLLNAVVPRDELLDAAYGFARRMTANAPLAVQATKQSVWEGLGMNLSDAYKNESRLSSTIFQTEDAKEGPKAFAEKRPPNWQGK